MAMRKKQASKDKGTPLLKPIARSIDTGNLMMENVANNFLDVMKVFLPQHYPIRELPDHVLPGERFYKNYGIVEYEGCSFYMGMELGFAIDSLARYLRKRRLTEEAPYDSVKDKFCLGFFAALEVQNPLDYFSATRMLQTFPVDWLHEHSRKDRTR